MTTNMDVCRGDDPLHKFAVAFKTNESKLQNLLNTTNPLKNKLQEPVRCPKNVEGFCEKINKLQERYKSMLTEYGDTLENVKKLNIEIDQIQRNLKKSENDCPEYVNQEVAKILKKAIKKYSAYLNITVEEIENVQDKDFKATVVFNSKPDFTSVTFNFDRKERRISGFDMDSVLPISLKDKLQNFEVVNNGNFNVNLVLKEIVFN
ncbi:hypothetical protein ABEB36_002842 [Hypothenemus hampei]|uniref:Kinetochore protein SPC25 n=1 Tax=Hypothenemus hampei TaxID=57062 RepID=A0ABD1F784_HYPHA